MIHFYYLIWNAGIRAYLNELFYDLARNVSFILVGHESLFFKLEGGGVIFTKNI